VIADVIDWTATRQQCPTEQCAGKRGKSVGIKLGDDGRPFAQCFRCHSVWRKDDDRPRRTGVQRVDVEQQRRREVAAEHARRQALADEQVRHAAAAARACGMWTASSAVMDEAGDHRTIAGQHPYLQRKRVLAHGTRVDRHGCLVVPMYVGDVMVNLQRINADGEKRFLAGGRTRGAYFVITDGVLDDAVVYIAEGFATGATVAEARGYPVIVAFSAGNLAEAAKAARDLYRDAVLIVAGDNDTTTAGNPGEARARDVMREVSRCHVITPDECGDWNDLYVAYGWEAVIEPLATLEQEVLRIDLGARHA